MTIMIVDDNSQQLRQCFMSNNLYVGASGMIFSVRPYDFDDDV